ncbi:MarR family transcriptional regulator [Clostridium sp. MSJ-11]|uniref:MarR family transcriptional regulator n=1 Tax=Clostridium mobile TaxID=2841512 RepID=A0ABS6EEU5_9CLOT|nr:MarR family transcriptional regulator [Clostridium mobile]MBU5483739.1 MarR family transcriptional regulator [Clostridium mobile]
MNEKLIQYVKEMREADYACNMMLLQEYKELMDDEITTKQSVLLELVHKHGSLNISEIAEAMEITSSAVSQIVSKLEKEGYIKREINPSNRREIFVEIDTKGVEYFKRYEEVERSIINRFYSKLNWDEIVVLRKLSLKFKKVIEKELQQK